MSTFVLSFEFTFTFSNLPGLGKIFYSSPATFHKYLIILCAHCSSSLLFHFETSIYYGNIFVDITSLKVSCFFLTKPGNEHCPIVYCLYHTESFVFNWLFLTTFCCFIMRIWSEYMYILVIPISIHQTVKFALQIAHT